MQFRKRALIAAIKSNEQEKCSLHSSIISLQNFLLVLLYFSKFLGQNYTNLMRFLLMMVDLVMVTDSFGIYGKYFSSVFFIFFAKFRRNWLQTNARVTFL